MHVPDTGHSWAGSSAQEHSARTMGPTCRCSGRRRWCCSPSRTRWDPVTKHTGVTPGVPPGSSTQVWGWWKRHQWSPQPALLASSHTTLGAKQSPGGTTSPAASRTPTICAEARSCGSPRDGEGCISGADGAKQLLFTGT